MEFMNNYIDNLMCPFFLRGLQIKIGLHIQSNIKIYTWPNIHNGNGVICPAHLQKHKCGRAISRQYVNKNKS